MRSRRGYREAHENLWINFSKTVAIMGSNSRKTLRQVGLPESSFPKVFICESFSRRERGARRSGPFDVQMGVQSGIRLGECVFPLCGIAESFPESSLSANFPAAIVR
jgi:hypothetical protein